MDIPGAGMEDDTVVLAGSDDEGSPTMPFAPSNNSLLPVPSSSRPQETGSSSREGQEELGDVEGTGAADAAAVAATASQQKLSPPQDDMVLLEEEDAMLSSSPGVEVAGPPPVVAMEEGLESATAIEGSWECSAPSSSEAGDAAAAVEASAVPTPLVAGEAAHAALPAQAGEGGGAGSPGPGAAAADSAGVLPEAQQPPAAAV
jgi:hypothetical protein